MNLDKENMRKIKELILFTIIILIALWNYPIILDGLRFVTGIISPFLLGGGIAFVVNVPMTFLEEFLFCNKKMKDRKLAKRFARPLSLVLTLVIVIGVVVLVMFVVIPELTRTILSLGRTIQDFIPQLETALEELFTNNRFMQAWLSSLDFNVDTIINNAIAFVQEGAGDMLNSTFSAIGSIVSGVTTFAIAFVFACYILLQKERLKVQVQKVLYAFLKEDSVEWVFEVCALTAKSFSSFLAGQCLEALILGGMFFVVMSIFRMPYTLLISVLIAFTALIPIFGAFIGCVVGAFLILMTDPLQAVGFVIMFLVLQQIEGNMIYPKVVGKSVGLPSIWVLAAVTIGASLMGVVGMLIFIPIVSVVYSLFRASVHKRLRKKLAAENKKENKKEEKENKKENIIE